MRKLIITSIIILGFITSPQIVNAQTGLSDLEDALGFDETVNDVPEAPIHIFVGFGLLVGSIFGIRKIKN